MSSNGKLSHDVQSAAIGISDNGHVDEKKGTDADRADMYRMGKTQEMKRNFRFLSIFGFSMILMASWEFSLSVSTIGLLNGGTAGLIWMFFICWMGFILVNTSMAEMASMADANAVFTTFSDGGGWNSLGGSTLVGILAGVLPLLGADAAVHMSEELRDASRTLPRSMIMTTIFNGAFGWIMVVTYCFCIGNLEEVLMSPTGQPFMQVFYNSTQSVSSATAMASFIVAMTAFSNLTMVATSSRQLFAFARDHAVPFSPWFSKVPAGWDVPINAILTTFLFSSLLSLINIGSAVALNSITSLATSALLSSYMVSIGCMIWRRCTNSPLLPSKFSLCKWGLVINIASEAFLVVIFVLAFMPGNLNPTAAEMNWSILIYGAVAVFSLIYYVCRGTHRYKGPVAYVRRLDQ
ncbi:hypothetical protein ACHAPI_011541 [Fusarium lateritium]